MRFLLVTCLVAMLAFRGVGAQDAPGAKKTTISASKAKTATHRKSSKTVATKSAPSQTPTSKSATKTAANITTNNATPRRTKKSSKKPAPVAASRRYAQQQPTPQRYKEIQQTLADRGYFSGVPNGTWGPESMEALKRFQRDQNLTEDGKIGSLSLIALGLGPKRAAQEPTVEKTQQP